MHVGGSCTPAELSQGLLQSLLQSCCTICPNVAESPKMRRGGENFEFFGGPFSAEILKKIFNLGVKSPSFQGQLSGRVPPPLAFGTF